MRVQEPAFEMFSATISGNESSAQNGAVQRQSSQELVKDASKDMLDINEFKNKSYTDRAVENVEKTESERLKDAMKKPEGNKQGANAEKGGVSKKSDLILHDMEASKKEENNYSENISERMSQKIAGGYNAAQKSSISFLI